MFENLVISETAYELLFQESEPVYVFEQGVYGDDRTQDKDRDTGYPLWMVRVTASDAINREEQTLEVQVAAMDQPDGRLQGQGAAPEPAGADVLPQDRAQHHRPLVRRHLHHRRRRRTQARWQKGDRQHQDPSRSSGVAIYPYSDGQTTATGANPGMKGPAGAEVRTLRWPQRLE